jgi:hypothetical protein
MLGRTPVTHETRACLSKTLWHKDRGKLPPACSVSARQVACAYHITSEAVDPYSTVQYTHKDTAALVSGREEFQPLAVFTCAVYCVGSQTTDENEQIIVSR